MSDKKQLVLISKNGDTVLFAPPNELLPKLYRMTRAKWVEKGKPETIYV